MAPQFTRIIGRLPRGLRSWIAWANTSLPTPVSPSSRTVAGVGATCSAWARAVRIARLPDTIRREPLSSRTRGCRHSAFDAAGSRSCCSSSGAPWRPPPLGVRRRGLAQLLQLVERPLQRLVAGPPHQRLAEHARDDAQLLDNR